MAIKRSLVLFVLALFSLSLVACELSAATPPPTVATDEGSMGTLEAVLGGIATQTAAAGGGGVVASPIPAATTPAPEAEPIPTQGEAPAPTEEPTQPPAEEEEEEQAAPTNPPVVVPTATPGIPATYTLQGGEFPYCIARRFNVNPNELLEINGLGLNSRPETGFTLKIPQTGNPFPGDRSLQNHPTTYTVAAGDTIYEIACKFGDVDPLAIAQANGLSAPYNLEAGDRLNIP